MTVRKFEMENFGQENMEKNSSNRNQMHYEFHAPQDHLKADARKNDRSKHEESRRSEGGKKASGGHSRSESRKKASGERSQSESREKASGRQRLCRISRKCGGCAYLDLTYEEQLRKKHGYVRKMLGEGIDVHPVAGMAHPFHYRNKVSAAFQRHRDGKIVSGIYEEGTHHVIPVTSCLIEDEKADEIINTIRGLLPSFRIPVYDEDRGSGLLRHVLVRVGKTSGEVLVVLVCASPVFPSKNNFVRVLRRRHPEITSVVLNINDRRTSMVLGTRNIVLYGKGYIEDTLCGRIFRISPTSFYQINPVQTEVLYRKTVDLARLTGAERVFDAYSGIGTIGIIASSAAGSVTSVELNGAAVRDAAVNARRNGIKNITFYEDDAGDFLEKSTAGGEHFDVIFMDPPRTGSTEKFIHAAAGASPSRIVYISCEPETLGRDLRIFRREGYAAKEAWPVDMFPWTRSTECICLLGRK